MDAMTSAKNEREGQSAAKFPAIFAAHGAPPLLDDALWMSELAAWGKALPKPASILMISAHWEERPVTIGATEPVPLIYDFYGFPEKFYRMSYRAPGAPELAGRVRDLLRENRIACTDDSRRGLDHGGWVPLRAMYPEAEIPVLPISIPGLDPAELVQLGRALAPLRQEGVLIFGSGFLTHNMHYAFRQGIPAWAQEFDAWAREALERVDIEALMDFQRRAPGAREALPTWEHYAPVLVAAGAAGDSATATFPIDGWWMGSPFTKRSVQFD